jgi:subtilisin family serine protease
MTGRLARRLIAAVALWLAAAAWAYAAPLPASADPQQVLVLLRLPPDHVSPSGSATGGYSYDNGAGRAARRRIASRLAQAHGLSLAASWPMPLLGVDCFVMSVPPGRTAEGVVAELARDRDVAWSEPMHVYRAEAATPPNDPLFKLQPAAQQWRLADLHAMATGRSVRIAVVDSGVDASHPDLRGQLQLRENFVAGRPLAAEQHGTGVAGVIAARQDNAVGIAGVAPGARLMALRACWQQEQTVTVCDTLSLAKALHFAIDHDAQVINLSLGGPPDVLLGRLIDAATARGIVVVAAVDPKLARGGFPASYRGVVAVASSPASGFYVAPGSDVPTTLPGGAWALVNGSSYSAAHVSGLVALMKERSPRARPPVVLATLPPGETIDACASVSGAPAPCGDCACRITAARALTATRR